MDLNENKTKLSSFCLSEKEDKYYSIHIERYRFLLNIIKSLGMHQNANVLDVGCYPPFMLNKLSLIGFHCFGVSSPHEPLSGQNISILDIEKNKLPFFSNNFDLIIFSEILEHLYKNPVFVLHEIFRVLKKNGYLIITTPNVVRTQNIFNLIIGNNIYFPLKQFSEPVSARHSREYTLAELKTIITSSGFSIQKSGTFIAYPPYRQKNRLDPFLLKIVKLINFLLMKILYPYKDSLFLVAQK